MNKIKQFILYSGILLPLALQVGAQTIEKENVKGFIKDAHTGETLPYANISIKGTQFGTASNAQGYFVLVNAPVGACTLRVHYIGYVATDIPITVKKGLAGLEIKLVPKVIDGEEVIVTAENFETMEVSDRASQVQISPRQIAKLPAIGEVDIFRSLQLLPGISAVNDGNSGLHIRGGTPDQNLVLFDGMTIYNVDHFFGFISAFNAEAVKDVRVFKGGFPAKFGGRTSSVIELTGKSGSYDTFQGAANINLLSGNATFQVPIAGKGAWLVSMRRSYTDFLDSGLYGNIYNAVSGNNNGDDAADTEPAVGAIRRRLPQQQETIPDFYYYDLNSKLTWSLTKNDILSFSFYNGRDHLDESQDLGQIGFRRVGSTDTTTTATINDVTSWGNAGGAAKWARVWSDRFFSNFLVAQSRYYSNNTSGFGTGGENQNSLRQSFSSREENEVLDFTIRLENEYQLSTAHKVEFGLNYTKSNVSLDFVANDTTQILKRDDEAVQTAFYLQDQWQPIRPFMLTAGLRATHYGPTAKTYYEPRASMKFELNENFSVKGAWGQYHQFVNRIVNENVLEGNRDFWLLADERLRPGYSEHKIFGLSYENPSFLFDVEVYHKDLDGVAEFSQRFRRGPNVEPESLFFQGTGVSKGIEILAQKKTGRFTGWLSYTLGKTEYDLDVFNNGKPYLADQDRRHELKLVNSVALNRWNLAATWVYASGAPYTSPQAQYNLELLDGAERSFINVSDKNANQLPAYHRLDISATRQFSSEKMVYDLGLSIFNLYNNSNVWYREYVLDASPVIVRDVNTLGITPTITLRIGLK